MRYLLLFLYSILLMGTTPAERYVFKCEDVCEQDGDAKGIVVGGVCGCWNPRDIGKIPTKVGRYRGAIIKDQPPPIIINWGQ